MASAMLSPGQIVEPALAPVEPQGWQQNLTIDVVCPECQEYPPNIVEEFSSGDSVCGSCGLVLGDRIVDTRSEWRTFANDESGGDDPSRVGKAANSLFNGSQLETGISFGDGLRSRELNRAHQKINQDKSSKGLKDAYSKISSLCQPWNLPAVVEDMAMHLFKISVESNEFKGKNPDAIIAGCLFIACRQTGYPRTFKEINTATHVTKKEVGRIFKKLEDVFVKTQKAKVAKSGVTGGLSKASLGGGYVEKASTTAVELCDRYCSRLALSRQGTQLSKALAERLAVVGVLAGRSPLSAAAACIYMASHLVGTPKSPKEIATVAGVSDGTIRTAYKLLYLDKDKLIESKWLEDGKGDLKKLPGV